MLINKLVACLMILVAVHPVWAEGTAAGNSHVAASETGTGLAPGNQESGTSAVPQHTETGALGNKMFCEGIVDIARERRYYLKQEELKVMLSRLQEMIAVMDKKKAELEIWVNRREKFAEQATKNLVEIYSSMQPEASAARLAQLDSDLAASLLLAISPRQASAILNEMDQEIAASLTAVMAASARKKDPT